MKKILEQLERGEISAEQAEEQIATKIDELLELQKEDIKAWLHRRARDYGGISYTNIDLFVDDYQIIQYHKS